MPSTMTAVALGSHQRAGQVGGDSLKAQAERPWPPRQAIRGGACRVVLKSPTSHSRCRVSRRVVENADTFATLLECVRRDSRGVGWIAWGAGGAFEARSGRLVTWVQS